MALSFEDKVFWAKKGAKYNPDNPDETNAFYDLVNKSGMAEDSFFYYTNAYEAAGESGIKALTYKKKMPDHVRETALQKINQCFYDKTSRIPAQHKGKIGYLIKARNNTITVSEKRPVFNDPTRTSCSEVFQVRYTDYDDRWHLYWRRSSGKWWPYVPEKSVKVIEDCLKEVQKDISGCFWG